MKSPSEAHATAAKNLETFKAAELDTMIAAKYLEIETLEDAILQSPESAVEARQLLMTKIDNLDLEIIDLRNAQPGQLEMDSVLDLLYDQLASGGVVDASVLERCESAGAALVNEMLANETK